LPDRLRLGGHLIALFYRGGDIGSIEAAKLPNPGKDLFQRGVSLPGGKVKTPDSIGFRGHLVELLVLA
jgi:hypothetical protein